MQPNTIDLTKILKVGDKVYSDKRGWGEVIEINTNLHYPINVMFDESLTNMTYSAFGFFDEGCIMHELYPSCALEPWPEPCPFEKGELVWVNPEENSNKNWSLKRFYNMKDGQYNCFEYYYDEVEERDSDLFPVCRKFTDCPLPTKIYVK